MKSKKVSTTFTVLSMAAGMFLTPASAYAEPLASGQETVVDSSDVSTDDSVSEKTDSDSGASETPEKPEDSSSDTSKEPEEKDDSEDPAPTEPDVTPSVTPSVTPAPEPSKAPTPDASTSETKPKADSESTKKDANSSSTSTKDADPSSDNAAEAAAVEDWSQTINYENYIGKKDLRSGFARVDKVYAYAKVNTRLNVRESASTKSRIVGTLSPKALCYVISDSDQKWVYIESGDVRGFVKSNYLQQGKTALTYVSRTGEDNMELAEQVIDPEENEAFSYKKETVYDVTNSSGEGIITFAKQFVGNSYVWGGNSLTNGIDCSHFVWQILTRCGAYDGEYTTSYGWRSLGEEVKSLADAKAGDVVCYDGHVALYDGNGKIVEALNEDQGIVDTRKVDSDTILTIRRFTSKDEIGDTNAEKIWNYLRMHGFSKEGTAGIMGNIANEASTDLDPTLLESGSVKKSGLTGTQYTALVDAGSISREEVIHSSSLGIYSGGRYGYGLCGFTDPEIKSYLCKYTIDKGKSLGSISGQLDSLIAYLEKHNPSLLERLKTSDSVEDAATAFLREHEKCKDLDREEIERVSAAKQIYEVFQEYQSPVE